MILSTCIIIGNDSELPSLIRCINSFIDFTDEIIITANGEQVTEIEAYCKTEPKVKYFYHKWTKNFSEQRNFCASKVRPDADYYFWIDSDDVLVGAEHLRGIAEKAKKSNLDVVFFTYWYGCLFKGQPSHETLEKVELTQTRERLLKPGVTVWKKRLHETPVPIDNIDFTHSEVKYSQDYPIAWLHLGVYRNMDEADQKAKTARNREILELQLEEERATIGADPRTLIYLMKIYGEEEDEETLQKTIVMGNEYLIKSGWNAERAMCCCIMGKSLGKLGKENEAKELLFRAIKEYPYDPMLYLHLSRSCGNLKQYREMKHWLEFALTLDPETSMSNVTNLLELKLLSTELAMHYEFNAERNVRKAYKAMRMLYNEMPNQRNREGLDYLQTLNDLEEASASAHKLMLYYQEQSNSNGIVGVVESMPESMKNLPFSWAMFNKHKESKKWEKNEICYYATFGKPHLEHWDGKSIYRGLGGSETAVIKLSEEWVKKGYKVTVYGDPLVRTEVNGVKYLPFFEFNSRDHFNIFIQHRSAFLARRIKAKKFLVDLHDLVAVSQFIDKESAVDKFMVKSRFHASLLEGVELERIGIVSNGI
jgi:glycosyltransferase involved in cell wall biosynthesis